MLGKQLCLFKAFIFFIACKVLIIGGFVDLGLKCILRSITVHFPIKKKNCCGDEFTATIRHLMVAKQTLLLL